MKNKTDENKSFDWLANGLGAVVILLAVTFLTCTLLPSLTELTTSTESIVKTVASSSKLLLLMLSVLSSLLMFGVWFLNSGKDQTRTTAVPSLPTKKNTPVQVFRFRWYRTCAVLSFVFAGGFLLPILAAFPLILFTKFGSEYWFMLVVLGLFFCPFSLLLWRFGQRYSRGAVRVDDIGIDVRSVYSNGRFTWQEITRFTKAPWHQASLKKLWSWCLHTSDGDRWLLIEPWLEQSDAVVEAIEKHTGLRLEQLPG